MLAIYGYVDGESYVPKLQLGIPSVQRQRAKKANLLWWLWNLLGALVLLDHQAAVPTKNPSATKGVLFARVVKVHGRFKGRVWQIVTPTPTGANRMQENENVRREAKFKLSPKEKL